MNKFIDKNYRSIVIVMLLCVLLIVGGFQALTIISPKTAGISNALFEKTLGAMMDEKNQPILNRLDAIEKNQPKIQDDAMVLLLEFHLNQWTTADKCNEDITKWEAENWGSQVSALKYVARKPEFMTYLEIVTIHPEVYKAFAMKAARY